MAQAAQIEATRIIEMIEAEVGSRNTPDVSNSGLLRILNNMPLATLLGLATSKCNKTQFGISLRMEVEALRHRWQDSEI